MRRFTLASIASAAVLAFAAAPAIALSPPGGDQAIMPGAGFELNAQTLEPGAFTVSQLQAMKPSVMSDIAVSGHAFNELHVIVGPTFPYDVDQVLVPGYALHGPAGAVDLSSQTRHNIDGYKVYNDFQVGSRTEPSIAPDETGTMMHPYDKFILPSDEPGGDTLAAPQPGKNSDLADHVIVVLSLHDGGIQNEPYEQAAIGEVAALNRPIITPKVTALGVSPITLLNTYKVGFGYSVDKWYDMTWAKLFFKGVDPQAGWFGPWTGAPGWVWVAMNPDLGGVRRYNDINEFGEAWGQPSVDFGQPQLFLATGDPTAFLMKSIPGFPGEQTTPLNLLSFSTQGDLPISWGVKASLAPERYARTATLTDADFRAWMQAWQDYYAGKGPKPTMPLAPGTNSPMPLPGLTVNVPVTAVTTPAGATVTQPIPVATSAGVTIAKSTRVATIRLRKTIVKKGHATFMSAAGLKVVKATHAGGRLVVKINLRGLSPKGAKWNVLVSGRDKHGQVVQYIVRLKL